MTTRIGVFGGTFDPPHIGHLIVAQELWNGLRLDRVLLVPANVSPLKAEVPAASASQRSAMLRAAVDGDDRFEVSEIELRREGPSYTVDTLRELSGERPEERPGAERPEVERPGAERPGAERPEVELFLAMGADQWARFPEWREPDEIARLAGIVVVARAGEWAEGSADSATKADSAWRPPFTELEIPRIDISSSLVRERVAAGLPIRYLVPEPVRRIIEAEKLYL